MTDSLHRSFGLVIAFLLPGFLLVLGVAALSPTVAFWLSHEPSTEPTFGGFFYVFLCSLTAGLIVSAMRWLVIDSLMHRTGVKAPRLNFSRLQANLQAYELAVDHNYRHYQFYGNSSISFAIFAICHLRAKISWPVLAWIGFVVLQLVLLITARDCLTRYYDRISDIIGR